MHFHLPKPLHGWREFAGEVGIIVVGVLIALGAEQVVEAVHDRHLAAETRSNTEAEVESNLGTVKFRLNFEACIQRRLDELHSIVDEWGSSGSFKAPNNVGGAPHAGMSFTRYDAAQAAGRLALLTNEQQYRMGAVVEVLKFLNEVELDEGLPWKQLSILGSGPKSLSESDRTFARQALQNADFLDNRFRTFAPQLLRRASEYGFTPNMSEVRELLRYYSKTGRYTPSICLPLDASSADVARVTGQVTGSRP